MGEKHSRLDFGDSSPENSLMHSAAAAVKPDFSGWATKFGLRCSDGRTIQAGSFEHQDSERVPLVWQHGHTSPENVLGHAILETRDEGVYAYGYFNDTAQAKNAKTLVQHGDITALSIFANSLIEKAKKVSHGIIREVSLVLAGANPGALIDNIEIAHSDGETEVHVDEAVIYTGLSLEHAAGAVETEVPEQDTTTTESDSVRPGRLRLHVAGAAGGRPLHGRRRSGKLRRQWRRHHRHHRPDRDRCLRHGGGRHPRGEGQRHHGTQRLRAGEGHATRRSGTRCRTTPCAASPRTPSSAAR
jgi:HK97 family phage prohead protease